MKALFLVIMTLSACSVESQFNASIRGRIGYERTEPSNKIIINHKLDITVDDNIIYKYDKDILQNSAVYIETATGKFVGIAINNEDVIFITGDGYASQEQVDFSKIYPKWQLVE